MSEPEVEQPDRMKSVIWEYAKSILIALVLALVIRTFVVGAYEIPSGSMEDTLQIGDYILVNKFIYGTHIPFTDKKILRIREPERGDVVVFIFPKDPDQKVDYIKRVVGLPGDRVKVVHKKVYVNDELYENPHAVNKREEVLPASAGPRDDMAAITVPAGSYFVMGDNRDNSYDSRFWGFVKADKIEGLAFGKYWSWDKENHRVRLENIGRPID